MSEFDAQRVQIKNEDDYNRIRKALSQQKLPGKILRLLMQTFEAYRSKRKIGWSRPWNKVNLVNFQSFRLRFPKHENLIKQALEVLADERDALSDDTIVFAKDLLHDKSLMGFIFIHEFVDNDQLYEGATLSFGRVANKRFRDRLDFIVESKIVGNRSKGFTRLRIYADPHIENSIVRQPLQAYIKENSGKNASLSLFNILSEVSWGWAKDETLHWNHWTSNYIDYFGTRTFLLSESFFHSNSPSCQRKHPESRLENNKGAIEA